MKKVSVILSLAALCSTLCGTDPLAKTFRQVYDLDPAKVKAYSKTLAADQAKLADWKNAPAFYYAVSPLSDVPRLPDTFPADGIPGGTIQIVASRGEYLNGLILANYLKFPFVDAADVVFFNENGRVVFTDTFITSHFVIGVKLNIVC